jgi:hypothetical protein
LKKTLSRLWERALQYRSRLLGSGFFGSAFFGSFFSHGNFGLDCDFCYFGFSIAFGFNRFNSGFGFHDFGCGSRFTCERDTSEKECSGSASKQFGHVDYPSYDTLPGGFLPGPRALAH